jgi:hypothetical protein
MKVLATVDSGKNERLPADLLHLASGNDDGASNHHPEDIAHLHRSMQGLAGCAQHHVGLVQRIRSARFAKQAVSHFRKPVIRRLPDWRREIIDYIHDLPPVRPTSCEPVLRCANAILTESPD